MQVPAHESHSSTNVRHCPGPLSVHCPRTPFWASADSHRPVNQRLAALAPYLHRSGRTVTQARTMRSSAPRVFVLFVWTLSATTSFANDLLRLCELALNRDPTLASSAAQRDAAVEARPQALAALLPQVEADASAARDRVGSQTFIGPVGQTTSCNVSASGTQSCYGNTVTYGVKLSQVLWNYESFERLGAAKRQAAGAEATLRAAQQELLLRAAGAYLDILGARDQLATANSEREAFATLLDQAKGREQAGVGPRSAVEQVQSFYDANEETVIDAENALDDARLAMTQITGEPTGDVAPLREQFPLSSPDPASIEDWVRAARHDNPTIQAAELAVQAADRAVSAELGRDLPILSLTTSSSRTQQNAELGGKQSFDTIGLSLSVPLFQGGAETSRLRQARAQYRQALADYEGATRNAESRARAAYRSVVSGIQRIAASRRAVESTRAAVQASRQNVEFGTGTEFDLLNAQNNHSTALRSFSQARYDYLRSTLTLKRQAGRLTKQDIINMDQLLMGSGS
jgi:outer membrane protein